MNYRSVVIHGMARLVRDADEKAEALTKVTGHLALGRWDEARPMMQKDLKSTTVITVPMKHAVAMARIGGPVDDDEEYALPIWGRCGPLASIF